MLLVSPADPHLELYLGIVIALLTFFLGRVTVGLESRRQFRQSLCGAIADLLEMRNYLLAMAEAEKRTAELVAMTAQQKAELSASMRQAIPMPTDFYRRYNDAVSVIAGFDPVLGYYMRSKDAVYRFLEGSAGAAVQCSGAASFFVDSNRELQLTLDSALARAARKLGWKVGPITYLRVRWVLREQSQISKSRAETIERLMASARLRLQAVAGGGAPPAAPRQPSAER